MTGPLLKITTTPTKIEYEVTRAKLETSQEKPQVSRKTTQGKLSMEKTEGRLEMNTKAYRSDMGFKDVVERAGYDANLARQKVSEATTNYVELGNSIINIQKGGNIPDALWSQAMQHSKGDLVLMPLSPADIKYVPASLKTDFEPGSVQSDWNVGAAKVDFVPGLFKLNIVQYSSISFEYLGGPIYVPASANPDFVGEA